MLRVRKRRRFDMARALPWLLGLIAVILAIVLLITLLPGRERSVSGLKKMPAPADGRYQLFCDGIVYAEEDKLYYVDGRGVTMWGFSGVNQDMSLHAGQDKVGVTAGRKLQVISEEGQFLFSREFESAVSDVVMGEKLIAVSLSDSDDIVILNGTGETVDVISSDSDAMIVRFGTFSDSSVWVISVENSGYQPRYLISTYKYTTEKTQTVTVEEDAQMLYDAFFDDNLCYLLGTQTVRVQDCDYTGSVNYEVTVNGFDYASRGKIGKKMHLLLLGQGRLKAVCDRASRLYECPESLQSAYVSEKYYYGFSEYFMYRIDPDKGKTVRCRLPMKIERVQNGSGFAILQSGNELYYLSMAE